MKLPGGSFITEGSILLPHSIWLNLEIQCYRMLNRCQKFMSPEKQLGMLQRDKSNKDH